MFLLVLVTVHSLNVPYSTKPLKKKRQRVNVAVNTHAVRNNLSQNFDYFKYNCCYFLEKPKDKCIYESRYMVLDGFEKPISDDISVDPTLYQVSMFKIIKKSIRFLIVSNF